MQVSGCFNLDFILAASALQILQPHSASLLSARRHNSTDEIGYGYGYPYLGINLHGLILLVLLNSYHQSHTLFEKYDIFEMT